MRVWHEEESLWKSFLCCVLVLQIVLFTCYLSEVGSKMKLPGCSNVEANTHSSRILICKKGFLMSSPHITLPWPYVRIARKLNSISFFPKSVARVKWNSGSVFIYFYNLGTRLVFFVEFYSFVIWRNKNFPHSENRRLQWRTSVVRFSINSSWLKSTQDMIKFSEIPLLFSHAFGFGIWLIPST